VTKTREKKRDKVELIVYICFHLFLSRIDIDYVIAVMKRIGSLEKRRLKSFDYFTIVDDGPLYGSH
jgi:hypothetical protein